MCQKLRSKSRYCSKGSNSDTVRTIDEVATRDRCVFSENELRLATEFMREVRGILYGESAYPISLSDYGILFEVHKPHALADSQISDIRIRLHDQFCGHNPRETDPTRGMNLVAKHSIQEFAPDHPWH